MDPHIIELPRTVIIGNNVLEKLPDVCKDLGFGEAILVLSDKITRDIAGDRAVELLKDSGINADIDIVSGSTAEEVNRIKSGKKPGIVVAVGGGTVIDVSKIVAFRNDVPFISVPTAPSHDGIASEGASITGPDGKKISLKAKSPLAIIADIGILKSAPYRLIAAGAADVISNRTAINDWKLANKSKGEYYSEYAAALSLLSSDIVINSTEMIREKSDRGIRNLIEALVSSSISMSLVGSSRPASGSEHSFSHTLDMMGVGGIHGEQCGIGSILMAKYQDSNWEEIRDALKAVGAPVSSKEIGIDKEKIIGALLESTNIRKRFTILDEKPLKRDIAEELCSSTGVC